MTFDKLVEDIADQARRRPGGVQEAIDACVLVLPSPDDLEAAYEELKQHGDTYLHFEAVSKWFPRESLATTRNLERMSHSAFVRAALERACLMILASDASDT